MIYLTKADIVAINRHQIQSFGGNFVPPDNFLHEANLDYLIEAVQAQLFGESIYPEVFQKAGLYMFNIVCNHIFQDGNKRTGLQTAIIFLLLNGHTLKSDVSDEQLITFTLDVASAVHSPETVQEWFQQHVQPL